MCIFTDISGAGSLLRRACVAHLHQCAFTRHSGVLLRVKLQPCAAVRLPAHAGEQRNAPGVGVQHTQYRVCVLRQLFAGKVTRFIATMNYGYAGTRELNEALTSRFAVVQMPTITQDNLEKLLRAQFPDLAAKYVHQFALLFLDLQKKCDSAEISTKALDLRGMLDALRLIRRGIPAGAALDMGITNKAFDSYEQGLIRDVIAARIPAKLDAGKLFA